MKFFIVLLCFGVYLFGSIGDVVALRGEATVHRETQALPLHAGMEILEGDEIQTREKTRVQVMLLDNTVVTIGANSAFRFDSFVFDATDKSEISMGASRGFFRTLTGEIGKVAPERFKVKTVSATIGIRGTDFSGEILSDKELIKCYAGRIIVEFEGGFREIDAGMMIEVMPETVDVKEIKEDIAKESQKEEDTKSLSEPSNQTRDVETPIEDLSDVTQMLQDVYNEPPSQMRPEPFEIIPEGVEREIKF